MLSRARGLVFDLDGTLIDSLDDIMLHLNAALAERGLPSHSREQVGEWVGYGARQLVERAVPDVSLVDDVLARYQAQYASRPVIHTRLYAGIAEALDSASARHRFAVLTNKPHAVTLDVCVTLLTRWQFDPIVGQQEGRPKKPDPRALLDVCTALDLAPADCVMVGDSEVDVATGRAAGVATIACAWGLRPVDVLLAAKPDHLAHSPAELRRLLTP